MNSDSDPIHDLSYAQAVALQGTYAPLAKGDESPLDAEPTVDGPDSPLDYDGSTDDSTTFGGERA